MSAPAKMWHHEEAPNRWEATCDEDRQSGQEAMAERTSCARLRQGRVRCLRTL